MTREKTANGTAADAAANGGDYRVLARKYRPSDFSALIGQEALVRTLTNAIAQGRLAHAFMLTGVRGVGKTTTARILARAFNCIGPGGTGGPTADPCGQCEHCRAIAEDRHVDVIEMDAASRTGVNDIRELIDGVRYRPVSARYKVYIIDEVHMLSVNAFNALLKTLEEPPAHVKFIFATTEIRKVPVTVLSRCQRFDLRRVDMTQLSAHFKAIAQKENASIDDAALTLIARAADGSVRDGLSLLDQALALADDGSRVSAAQVRDMLGLADRTALFDLYDSLLRGAGAEALGQLASLYQAGADPLAVMQDLLELTHWLTRGKLVPGVFDHPATPEAERVRGADFARKLTLPVLARMWQMLLKGAAEVQTASRPLAAAEMALIRLIYMADMPTPGDLVKALVENGGGALGNAAPSSTPMLAADKGDGSPPASSARAGGFSVSPPRLAAVDRGGRMQAVLQQAASPAESEQNAQAQMPADFDALVALFKQKKEAILHAHLLSDVHLVHYEPGRIEFQPGPTAPAQLANRLAARLVEWTGQRWLVSVSGDMGAPTLRQKQDAAMAEARQQAEAHPLVKAVLGLWPQARITSVRDFQPTDAHKGTEFEGTENDLMTDKTTGDDAI